MPQESQIASRHHSRSRSPSFTCAPTPQHNVQLKRLLCAVEDLQDGEGSSAVQCHKQEMIECGIRDIFGESIEPKCTGSRVLTPFMVAQHLGCTLFSARISRGRNVQQQNSYFSLDNHVAMILDAPRVSAFEQAIKRVVSGKKVLDLGSGAFCLLGRIALKEGAASVDAVEQSSAAVDHAVDLFKMELADVPLLPLQHLRETCAALCPDRMELLVPSEGKADRVMRYDIFVESTSPNQTNEMKQQACSSELKHLVAIPHRSHAHSDNRDGLKTPRQVGPVPKRVSSYLTPGMDLCPSCTLLYQPSAEYDSNDSLQAVPTSLKLYEGLSAELPLLGGYDVVLHELLGHVASAEGVTLAISDLFMRGLCHPECVFVPCAVATLIAPTSRLELTALEQILNHYHNGRSGLSQQTKYFANSFKADAFLAPPQAFERIEFHPHAEFATFKRHTLEFATTHDGLFDGLSLHMRVDFDGKTWLDTLDTETSWATIYIKLLEDGIWLARGSRILCDCSVSMVEMMPSYTVSVSHGQPGLEVHVADFSWEGS